MGNQLPHPHAHSTGGILILGSSGSIGKATAKALVALKAEHVFAGMRDETKGAGLFDSSVKVVKVDMGDAEAVAKAVKENHCKRVMIISPGAENRAAIASAALKGAKKGGAHFVAVVSVLCVPFEGTCFADQFIEIEAATKKSGMHYSILRLPFFVENIFGQVESIKKDGKYYGHLPGDKKFSAIATDDAGKAFAEVLSHPGKYHKKTFDLVSDVYSNDECAKALGEATGKTVEYVVVPEQAAKESMVSMGFPEWQAQGIVELNKLIDLNLTVMKSKGDLEKLGIKGTSITEWAKGVGESFK